MSTGEFTDAASWGGRPVAHKIADAVPGGRVVVAGTVRRHSQNGGSAAHGLEPALPHRTGQRLGRPKQKEAAERSEQRA